MFPSLSWMIRDGLKGANLAHCGQRCQMIGAALYPALDAVLSLGCAHDTIQNPASDPHVQIGFAIRIPPVSRIVHSMKTQ